jgi:hypothetical protein
MALKLTILTRYQAPDTIVIPLMYTMGAGAWKRSDQLNAPYQLKGEPFQALYASISPVDQDVHVA